MNTVHLLSMLLILTASLAFGREYHVSIDGDDDNEGSADQPFGSISAAAEVAKAGDVITVHEGTYRERVNPPRGGVSDENRIVYQAAPGAEVILKGSEVVHGWEKVQNDTWKVTLPNEFFGDFNPYADLMSGDWFAPQGRDHHTGAVYLEGHWLTEAARLEDVLEPIRDEPIWAFRVVSEYLMNVAWIQPGSPDGEGTRVLATDFTKQSGIQKELTSEGGECVAHIQENDWVRYDEIDFGHGAEKITIRAASETQGGVIEIRKDGPGGELLGTSLIPDTGGWQSWKLFTAKIQPTAGVETICLVFRKSDADPGKNPLWDPDADTANPELWFAKVGQSETTIWAQFNGINPNEADVEINVRQTVFYPEKTGIDYLTVRGFTMKHAATPWAPPTAEQIGLIGTHWSKGWIIEDNDISYSTSTGVTLGKHGDEWDNTSADTASGYVETIDRAIEQGWSKENIGHHIVRNNRISHCEQAGLVGSLGAIFSTISGNTIHDIHVRQLFTGAEMAGIKLHAPIDTLISDNHIYRSARGMWLDWMTQGTRVTRNLLHDNDVFQDLYIEVNHGPYVVDNNIMLSRTALYDQSQGGAYVHNLFAGEIVQSAELNRKTPYHTAHSTVIAGLRNISGGDNRFYNNLFLGGGLVSYDEAALQVHMGGNVYLHGAQPSKFEKDAVVLVDFDSSIQLARTDSGSLELSFGHPAGKVLEAIPVSTDRLGKTKISELPYRDYNGRALRIDTDYFGNPRDELSPVAGPFEEIDDAGRFARKVREKL